MRLYLDNSPGSGVFGISQTFTDVLTAGKTYSLRVDVGDPLPDEFTGPGFPGYAVQLLAGSQVIAQDYNTQNVQPGTFVTSSLEYTASPNDRNLGQPLQIRLLNVLQSEGKEVDFDRVRFDVTTPDVLNPGFETPVFDEGGFVEIDLPGWDLYDPSGVVVPPGSGILSANAIYYVPGNDLFRGGASEGNNILSLGSQKPPGSGYWGVSQNLLKKIEPNTTYSLKVDVGNIAPVPGFDYLAGFPGYAVQLLADGKVIAQDFNSFVPAEATFQTSTVTYTSTANDPSVGKDLEIRLLNTMQYPGGETSYDNVRLDVNPAIANPGFETPVFDEGGFVEIDLPGWDLYDPSGVVVPPGSGILSANAIYYVPGNDLFRGGASEGNNILSLGSQKPPGSGAWGVSQQLGKTIAPNTTYTLKADVGNIAPVPGFDYLAGFPGYAVQFLADGQVIAQDTNSFIPDEATFQTSTVTYTASANDPNLGKQLEIRLLNLMQTNGVETSYDNVQFEETKLPSGLFNEAYYLQNNPDIAGAIGAGQFASGLDHFDRAGLKQGRNKISPYYNEAAYLQINPDVAQAVAAGAFASGLEQFVEFGYDEGRFSPLSTAERRNLNELYLQQNSDVAQAVGSGLFNSGYDHYLQFGSAENRSFF